MILVSESKIIRHFITQMVFLSIALFFPCHCCFAAVNTKQDVQIQGLLDGFRKSSHAPAVVLSINFSNNKILNYTSGNIQKITRTDPNPPNITTDNLFQIGSITKSFTAVIILQLEAEGKLSINDTVAEITQKQGTWLPKNEYPAWRNISIKQLLNMTSGIFDVTEDKNFMKILTENPQKTWSPTEIIEYANQHKPYFSPGMGWHYTNSAYNILGLLIEKVTHHPFEVEIRNRLLEKYDLRNTFYLPYAYPKQIFDRMAHGYVYYGGGFSPPMKSGEDMTRANMSAAGPSGALISNSIDITKWIRLLFSNKILPMLQMNELKTAVCTGEDKACQAGVVLTPGDHSQGYSLGLVRIYDPKLGLVWVYFGDTPGYSSGFIWLPKQNIGLAMTISATSKNGRKLLKQLSEMARLIQK